MHPLTRPTDPSVCPIPVSPHARLRRAIVALLGAVALVGCPADEDKADRVRSSGAHKLAGAEGAVCGMVVSEQPAPRAQVVHRDGTRLYLCGIADLLLHLDAHSPHGASVEIYVEAMEVDEDPRDVHLGEHEWVRAEGAIYRIGDERPGLIMGTPVMVYRDRSIAENAIAHGPTKILGFEELQAWWRRQS